MSARPTLPLGLVYDLPIDEYHASAGISNSGLSDFAKSPRHYHALHINPDRPAVEETPAQLVGNLAHCATLEPDAFATRYAVGPNGRRGTKVWDAFEASLTPHQTGIKPDQAQVAKAQALSLRSIPDAAALLATGRAEVSAYWIDPETGELCRCRPDFVQPVGNDSVILLDIKTCSDASRAGFAKQATRMRYAHQAAFYSDGYQHASGKSVVGFVFLPIETDWPFDAAAYMLPDEWLDLARAETASLIEGYAACRAADHWPSYSDTVQLLDMPEYLKHRSLTTESTK